MHRDPTLFPSRDEEGDDAAQPAPPAEDAGPRRLPGHIRAGDMGEAHTARSRRRIDAPEPGRLRDVDTAGHAQAIHGCAWAGYGGIAMGFVFFALAYVTGVGAIWYLPAYGLGWLVGTGAAFAMGNLGASGAATFVGVMFGGGRAGAIKAVRQYSLPESLAIRGDYAGARREYERLAEADPADPEPPTRLARLWRDEENRPEEAAVWFRRALAVPGLNEGQTLLLLRELVEVLVHRLHEPRRAFPDLARVARTMEGTPAGTWAAAELKRLKAEFPPPTDVP